ncbi:MAG: protein-tyrosine kinase [Sphingomonadales bacterium]|jgi:exopolysaccharide/PEP-CTERM locus tyrosine autokinase|nr:protein-tyrosine kinase [Sphingomonadales bacterium]
MRGSEEMKHVPIRTGPSLLERAAEIYDFGSGALIAPAPPIAPEPAPEPEPLPLAEAAPPPSPEPVAAPEQPLPLRRPPAAAPRRAISGRSAAIDRVRLRQAGFILPEVGSSTLAEELRLVKRQLLRGVAGRTGIGADKRRTVLVCSAQPGEGKTFCALNLALSLAAESDVEVLLVDCDVAKPEALALLGIESGPGLIDALADPALDPESCVIRTDVDGLSVLPAGRQANNVPELLASARTGEILAGLAAADPRRIVLIDSPPVLMASPAGILAGHVGQVLVVVRADSTTESDLKEAVGLLSACDHVGLVLNGAGFAASGRRFGQYEESE